MFITEYDDGTGKCVSCGNATLHTRQVIRTADRIVRVRVCRKCEKRLPQAYWDGVVVTDAKAHPISGSV